MNIFRKFGSKKNSKGVIGESSDNDLHPWRLAEVRPCEWPHIPFLQEAGIHEEFMQFIANAGLGPYLSDKCEKCYLLTESFVKGFKYFPRESRVLFMLYDEPFTIPLENFAYHCKLPFWSSLD